MPEDLITVLLDGRDHGSGRSLSRREIRDNIITFIAVGSETSANALTWALYLLCWTRSGANVSKLKPIGNCRSSDTGMVGRNAYR